MSRRVKYTAPVERHNWTIGDICYLKSGGPPMMVTDLTEFDITVMWIAQGSQEMQEAIVPDVAIQREAP